MSKAVIDNEILEEIQTIVKRLSGSGYFHDQSCVIDVVNLLLKTTQVQFAQQELIAKQAEQIASLSKALEIHNKVIDFHNNEIVTINQNLVKVTGILKG